MAAAAPPQLPGRRATASPRPCPAPPTQQRRRTPAALPPVPQVWHIESTGEVFRSYEAYLQRMELYKQGVWSCKYTGKGGLTFEEAQQAEAKAVKQLDSVRHWAGPQTATAPAQLLPGPLFQPLREAGRQRQPTATATAACSCRWRAGWVSGGGAARRAVVLPAGPCVPWHPPAMCPRTLVLLFHPSNSPADHGTLLLAPSPSWPQFPKEHEERVCRSVHHSLAKVDELVASIYDALRPAAPAEAAQQAEQAEQQPSPFGSKENEPQQGGAAAAAAPAGEKPAGSGGEAPAAESAAAAGEPDEDAAAGAAAEPATAKKPEAEGEAAGEGKAAGEAKSSRKPKTPRAPISKQLLRIFIIEVCRRVCCDCVLRCSQLLQRRLPAFGLAGAQLHGP